jgi:high affinity choline transporter 7
MVQWWDLAIMLVAGGIPWNCYFQRVQSCQTPARAAWHSVAAGVITISMTGPPLLLGVAAFSFPGWTAEAAAELQSTPAMALPLLLSQAVPPLVGILGLAAIVGAVTSSFSASIMSAGSMVGWNFGQQLFTTGISDRNLKRLVRASILILACLAVLLALRVQSVQQLWFFTSDLVFVLLFPQLVFALFDPKANRTGSVAAFLSSLLLRLGGGEPIFSLPAWIPYDEILASTWPGLQEQAAETGDLGLFPVRTFAALVGMIALPVVSRLTGRWDPPRPIRNPVLDESH